VNLICQQEALNTLKLLASHQQHGVLLVGNSGSGKTYLARQYASMLGIPDFYMINPVIADLKTMVDSVVSSETPVVLCIENLDNGVVQASAPLLKFIEDCPKHIYIVVTCNNYYAIPDTIPSRCALVTINPPTKSDIDQYAKLKDTAAYEFLKDKKVWSCIKGFGDADIVLKFTPEHLKYFEGLEKILWKTDTVSNIAWKLQHYENKTETPLPLVIRYLMQITSPNYQKVCVECLNDLADNRISKNAIVSKLVFELKYTK
jgi:hypothetical protein